MVPEAQFAFYMAGAGHMMNIPYPSFPDCAGLCPVNGALALIRVCGISDFPFAASAGIFCVLF
jgi:hypothetical protein